MEAHQFDQLTRDLARPLSRGGAVKVALAAALAGMFGMSNARRAEATTSRCAAGTTLCNGQCVPNNPAKIACGGVCCSQPGQVCVAGKCCPSQAACGTTCCSGGQACFDGECNCASGQGFCNNTCAPLNTTQNCGTCGKTCTATNCACEPQFGDPSGAYVCVNLTSTTSSCTCGSDAGCQPGFHCTGTSSSCMCVQKTCNVTTDCGTGASCFSGLCYTNC